MTRRPMMMPYNRAPRERVLPGTPGIEIANRFLNERPVNLVGMAQALGIRVNDRANLASEVSGLIRRHIDDQGQDEFHIEVNGRHSSNRRRFTLAHEIAHFLLHRNLMTDGIVDNEMYRSGLSDALEHQANRLAAELLMPASLIRSEWRSGNRAIAPLAAMFGASEEAMRIRLESLGLGA